MNTADHVVAIDATGAGAVALFVAERGREFVMPEEILLSILGVFGALAVATIVAYVLLNNENLHMRNRH